MGLVPVRVTPWSTDVVNTITGTTTNPTKGTTTVDRMRWRRVGGDAEIIIEYKQTAGGAAGSGDYLFAMPSGLLIDTTKRPVYSTIGTYDPTSSLGQVMYFDALAASGIGVVVPYSTTQVRFMLTLFTNVGNIVGSGFCALNGTNRTFLARFLVPIQGWS